MTTAQSTFRPFTSPGIWSSTTQPEAERALLSLIRQAVATCEQHATADILKSGLVALARSGALQQLSYPAANPSRYTRRLVYSDPWSRFVVIGMTWSAGQHTALHDHAGVWCVEVVVDGEMEVTNYELLSEDHAGCCRFERRQTISAPPASSGALIPPFEHHTFGNVGQAPSHTLHVYGGPMNRCNIFEPTAGGTWQRRHRDLHYDD